MMKGLVLAAGLGTRLRPLTLSVPKVLLPIAGRPLLEYHLLALAKAGVREILVNTHYLPEQVNDFVESFNRRFPKIKITVVFEPVLLGSAGTLLANKNFFSQGEIVVAYGDNLTNINYQRLFDFHHQNKGLGSIAVYHETQPEFKGIVNLDATGRIKKFIEKPQTHQVVSNFANAGIYVFSPDIFNCAANNRQGVLDFGHHIFPELLAQGQPLFAYQMDEFLLDIGTMASYNKAQLIAEKLISNFNL